MNQRSLFLSPVPTVSVIIAMVMLVIPAQLLAQNKGDDVIMTYYCGGLPASLNLGNNKSSGEPRMPHDCCKTACHVALDRKKKGRNNECC